jgi:two-component system, OmpR family, alkaline phosphatase synthesis response regulator PhoP
METTDNTIYKILIVDDEPDILEFLGYNLTKEGFRVFTATNGTEAIKQTKEINPHLIILDIMMPGIDGIETCKEIKQFNDTAIILFLTARSEDYTQIAGFESGADDYVAKPIKPRVLISRIKALLRRQTATAESEKLITIDNLIIDKEKYTITKEGVEIVLPRKEFELLSLLASKPNKVFTRDEIFAKVWGEDVIVGERTIDVHIRKIREKIGIDNVKTIKGVGYKYEH